MEVEEIIAEVTPYPAKHVVLTGGEPMIAPGIYELAFQLQERGYHITIETAATVPPKGIAMCVWLSISPGST